MQVAPNGYGMLYVGLLVALYVGPFPLLANTERTWLHVAVRSVTSRERRAVVGCVDSLCQVA